MTECKQLIINQIQSVLAVYKPNCDVLTVEEKRSVEEFEKCLQILESDNDLG